MRIRIGLAVAIATLGVASAAEATVMYTNNVETGFRFTPGGAATADNRRVAFDDVPIPNSRLGANTWLDVTRVTVGIRQVAPAPTTDVEVYWATLTTGPTPPDTELDSPGSSLGITNLPAQGASVTSLVTLGDGVNTLFTTPLNSTLFSGFGTFAIGVRLSDTGGNNGWRITSGPDANADAFWLYDPGHTFQANDEGTYSFGGTPVATFYIVVEGTPFTPETTAVPEPSTFVLVALGLVGLGCVALRKMYRRA